MSTVDPKDTTQPDINVYVSQLCDEIRALKGRINVLETRIVRAPDGEVLSILPIASSRALKTATFDAMGNLVADAPVEGDYSAYAVELANRLKRDGSQNMLGELILFANAVSALGAVPLQQMQAADAAVQAYAQLVGAPKISQLPRYSYAEDTVTCLVVKTEDNRLLGWGTNINFGQGTGSTANENCPPAFAVFDPPIPGGATIAGWEQCAGAALFVWLSNGWCYFSGGNGKGPGGFGDTVARYRLQRIPFFFNNAHSIVQVIAHVDRTDVTNLGVTFLTAAGWVYSTGYSTGGVAGDGNNAAHNVTSPVRVGTLTGVIEITSGGELPSAVFGWKADGTCYAWGYNRQGWIGNGTTADQNSPITIAGVTVTKVRSRIARNSVPQLYGNTLFLLQDGTVRAVGFNGAGQLGNGSNVDVTSPVVVTGLTNIRDIGITGGDIATSWAIDTTNNLKLWGSNSNGKLGIGSTVDQNTPQSPVGWIAVDGTVTASGSPPFQGKVSKVIGAKTFAGGGIGADFVLVLDTDGNLWLAGRDFATLHAQADNIDVTRFKQIPLPPMAPNDKIVDIICQGATNAAKVRVFARTQLGKIFASGYNHFGLCTASLPAPQYIYGLQPVPIPL